MEKIEQPMEEGKNDNKEHDIIDYRNFLQGQIKAMVYIIKESNRYPSDKEIDIKTEQKVQEAHKVNQLIVREKVIKLMLYEKKLEIVMQVLNTKKYDDQQYKHIQKHVHQMIDDEKFHPTEEQIHNRIDTIVETDSGWTDATQSVNEDDEEIWVVDDDVVQAMDIDSAQQQIEEESDQDEQEGQNGQEKVHKKKKGKPQTQQQQQVDLEQFEDQFVQGGQSDHVALLGKHQKFCVSLNYSKEKGILVSGGGDDQLLFYKVGEILDSKSPIEFTEKRDQILKPFHIVKHTETINKICLSYDGQHVFSLTDNEALSTDLETMKTEPLPIQNVSDICTHPSGGAIAIASGYEVHLYSTKKLTLYSSYYLDAEVNMISFTTNGKQIVAACDNKIRIITPKTEEVIKISGPLTHGGQITAMATEGNLVVTGDIDGFVCATSLSNNTVIAKSQNSSTVNQLLFAHNYILCGCAEESISWFDTNKIKKIFQNQLQGTPTGCVAMDDGITFAVATIKGRIYLYDRRQPLAHLRILKTGSTVHSLWSRGDIIAASCEDGLVRIFDRRINTEQKQQSQKVQEKQTMNSEA